MLACAVSLNPPVHDLKQLMRGQDPVSRGRWRQLASDVTEADYVLSKLKASVTVIAYLNRGSTPNPNGKLTVTVNNVGRQLVYAQRLWNQVRQEPPASSPFLLFTRMEYGQTNTKGGKNRRIRQTR